MSSEYGFLLACLAFFVRGEDGPQSHLRRHLDEIDWQRLSYLATAHGLAAVLYEVLDQAGLLNEMDQQSRKWLFRRRLEQVASYSANRYVLHEVSAALAEEG